jgi:hypothetical protein
MRLSRRWSVVGGVLLAIAVLSGCSTYARPDTSSIGLMYSGGDYDVKTFQGCVLPGDNIAEDWGGSTAYYPTGVITVDFAARPDSEMGPIGVSTSNNQEIIQSGTTSIRLQGLDCKPYTDATGKVWPGGKLQKFHEEVGQRNGAAFGADSSQRPSGWVPVLITFVGAPTERSLDQAGGVYPWQDIYGKADIQGAFAKEAIRLLPEKLAAAAGGEQYFDVLSVELDKPQVSGALKDQMERAEADALARTNAQADQDFIATFPGGAPAYQAWKDQQSDARLKDSMSRCFDEGRCNAVPVGPGGGG